MNTRPMIGDILWVSLTLIAGAIAAIPLWQDSRRQRSNPTPARQMRVRRRSIVLFLLMAALLIFRAVDRIEWSQARYEFIGYGVCLILVILVMILALRDLRAINESYQQDRQRATLEAMRLLHGRQEKSQSNPDKET